MKRTENTAQGFKESSARLMRWQPQDDERFMNLSGENPI
jgi:hypothetical protein